MLLIATLLKLLAEIAGLALVGQAVLGWLAGPRRQDNPVYRIFCWMTAPVLAAVRRLAPRTVAERHLPRWALLAVLLVWLAATGTKIGLCLQAGLHTCR